MRKTLKSQGTIEQWVVLIQLSLEQMKLDTEIQRNTIYALHKGLQVMKFDISEDNGIIVNIDYFDEQDLEDFRKFAAKIIKNPDAYRNPSKTEQPEPEKPSESSDYPAAPDESADESIPDEQNTDDEFDDKFYDPSESASPAADAFYDSDESTSAAADAFYDSDKSTSAAADAPLNKITDLMDQNRTESSPKAEDVKPVRKNKKWPTVLIVLGIIAILAVVGLLGYRFYQQKQIPSNLLSQAVTAYNAGDYETAVTTAATIVNDYPNSDQANTAQTLLANAQAELDKALYASQVEARKQVAQSMFAITSQSMTGPDGDGDVHLFFSYTNHYSSNLVSVSFGVNFTDAGDIPVLIEGADTETIICTDEQGLAANTALSADLIRDFGPYRNAAITGFKIVSVEVTYEDGTVLTLGSTDEASWVLVL